VLFLTTKKTLTDHGLSLITQKDCSIWRGVSKGELCREQNLDKIEVVVERAPQMDGGNVVIASAYPLGDVDVEALPQIETVETDAPPQFERSKLVVYAATAIAPADTSMDSDFETAGLPTEPPAAAPVTLRTYLIVGSFRTSDRAERLASRLGGLPVSVLPGMVDGRRYHRVAVGPVAPGTAAAWRARLAGNGIAESWALKIYEVDEAPGALEVAAVAGGRRLIW
jgi:hypothetical protein